jgi:hypothetical protein
MSPLDAKTPAPAVETTVVSTGRDGSLLEDPRGTTPLARDLAVADLSTGAALDTLAL